MRANDLTLPFNKTSTVHDSMTCESTLRLTRRLKVFSVVAGMSASFVSQLVFYALAWKDDLTMDSRETFIFSLKWAFWSCVLVFTAMGLHIGAILRAHKEKLTSSREDFAFQLESLFLIASIFSILAIWVSRDILHLPVDSARPWHAAVGVALYLTMVGSVFFMGLPRERSSVNHKNICEPLTRSLILSAVCGSLCGVLSQVLLTYVFVAAQLSEAVRNTAVASCLWSISTVIFTLGGCRCLFYVIDASQRAEAIYAGCSLLGIGFSWVMMDVTLHLWSQIVPSMLMMLLSLLAFHVILVLLPADTKSLRKGIHTKLTETKEGSNNKSRVLIV